MKKTSSPPPFFSRILFITMALTFLGIQAHAQRTFLSNYQVFDKGIRINGDNNYGNTEALSLHPTVTFELDAPGVIGGRFGITTDGLVGIGNNKPIFALDVAHSGSSGWVTQFLNKTSSSGIHLGGREIDGIKHGIIGSIGKTPLVLNPDGGDIHFGSQDNSDLNITAHGKFTSGHITTTGLTIDHGNVGIGVTDPGFLLDVAAPENKLIAGWTSQFKNETTNTGVHFGGRSNIGIIGSLGKTPLVLNPDGGNVGIGVTMEPTEKLEVNGNIKTTGKVIAEGGIQLGNGTGILSFLVNGAPTFRVGSDAIIDGDVRAAKDLLVTDKLGIGTDNPLVPLQVQGPSRLFGNVGIGTEDLTEKLQVDGNIKATGKIIAGEGIQLNNISESMYFAENGDVGIGVVPGTGENRKGKLHVKGSFHVENDNHQVFHVSSGRELVFIGTSAYEAWKKVSDTFDQLSPEQQKRFNSHSVWASGGITSEDFTIQPATKWPDHVFEKSYDLPSLETLKTFIKTHKHLPDVPSESEVREHGYSLKNLHYGFLKNIEELALHTITQEEKINELEAQLEEYEHLGQEVKQLKATLEQLTKTK
ncbi:hypothetical protein [Ulvibacterium sp.]|uniref:hypothetical protein n=1 Tax=Ulvibacterium sp. TaxID=2665914 RepID=UPI003CC556D3